MATPPSFFSMFTIQSYRRMKIPLKFIQKSLKGQALPETVSIKDRYDNIWQVKVSKVKGDFYFTSGWSKLICDNSIISGDFLVFEYPSESLFTIKLMGLSGIKKEGLGSFIPNIPHENHNIMQENRSNSDNNDGFERMDGETFHQIHDPARENIEQEYQNLDDDNCDHQSEDMDVDEDDGNGSPRPQVNYNRKCYGMAIFKAGLAPQPRNPYFVAKYTNKRKSNLFVPLKVIEDHNLDLNQDLSFVDNSCGRQYLAKYKKWQDGRVLIAGGWRALCAHNNVKLRDTYICEFIQRTDRKLVLSISFVRK